MAKGADVWMPIFIGDHLAETSDFDTIEHGAYVLLLMRWWQSDGSLPDSDPYLARVSRLTLSQWRKIKPSVMRPFYLEGDIYRHKRMYDERQKAHANVEKRRLAGLASGRARRGETMNTCSTPVATHVQPRAGDGEGEGSSSQSISVSTALEDIFRDS